MPHWVLVTMKHKNSNWYEHLNFARCSAVFSFVQIQKTKKFCSRFLERYAKITQEIQIGVPISANHELLLEIQLCQICNIMVCSLHAKEDIFYGPQVVGKTNFRSEEVIL